MIDWTNASRINGPGFAAWLERVAPERLACLMTRNGDINRYCLGEDWFMDGIGRARRGRDLSFQFVDRILTRLDMHVSQVPSELWTKAGKTREAGPPRSDTCSGCGCEFSDYTTGCRPCIHRRAQRRKRARELMAA